MKRISFVLLLVLFGSYSLNAQIIRMVGMTSSGGKDSGGTIFSAALDGSDIVVLKDFNGLGADPSGTLTEGSDGMLYGVTSSSGLFNAGTIFRIAPDGTGFQKLHDFDGTNSSVPRGALLRASDGKLYGTTSSGGSSFAGTIFCINEDGTGFQKLHEFDRTNGGFPSGSLMEGIDGKLYGMTVLGGSANAGVIFSLKTGGTDFTKIHDFDRDPPDSDNLNGKGPRGSLTEGNDGKLYGITRAGGSNNSGVIFRITKDGAIYEKLHDLDETTGVFPWGSLTKGQDGKFYGMTVNGGTTSGGTIFQLSADGATLNILYHFEGNDGSNPFGTPVLGTDGMLYGMTSAGGTYGAGAVFRITTAGTEFEKLHDFDGENGNNPQHSMIQTDNGKFYGIAGGGISNAGVIFSINMEGTAFEKLHDFDNRDGGYPNGAVIQGGNKMLYGMAASGGGAPSGDGVIFRINTDGTGFEKLHSFSFSDGTSPQGSLVEGNDGMFYAMTRFGSTFNEGGIFRIGADGSGFEILHGFQRGNGRSPMGSLIQGSDGMFYGMTHGGGSANDDMIFRIHADGSGFEKLHDFDGAGGRAPFGSLVQGIDGMFYGTTRLGGLNNNGVIFGISADGTVFNVLHNFAGADGRFPKGSLIVNNDGRLYGLTSGGGAFGTGTVFSMQPDGTGFTKLHNFNTTNGANPEGSLTWGNDGKLYGMTLEGGTSDGGVIFRLNTDGSAFEKLYDLDESTGMRPLGGIIFVEVKEEQKISFNFLKVRTYGDPPFKILASATSGLPVSFESSDESIASISGDIVTIHQAGNVIITASQPGNENYKPAAPHPQKFIIEKAALTAQAIDTTKAYGQPNPELRVAYTGFANNDTKDDLDNVPIASSTADETTDAGEARIIVNGGSDNNYDFSYAHGILTITKASLTATADNKVRSYGESNPEFSINYSGLANNDTMDDLDTPPTVSSTADETTGAGEVEITVSGGSDNNYEFSYVPGILTIAKAPLTATADDMVRSFGEPNPEFSITYFGFVNGEDKKVLTSEPEIRVDADKNSKPGEYPIRLIGGKDENYAFTRVNGTLTIDQVTGLTVENSSSIVLYPNPVTRYLHVDIIRPAELKVYSPHGKLLTRRYLQKSGSVDLLNLPAGYYLLELRNGEKEITQTRIIKR